MDSKAGVFVAVHAEDFVILACVVLTQYRSVTDGRTDALTMAKPRELVMIQYIENIDISFSISIYHIVSYREKILNFLIYRNIFYISRYFQYSAIFYTRSLYFYYCITKVTTINGENDKLTEAN